MQVGRIDSYQNYINKEPRSTPQPEGTDTEVPFVVDLTGNLDLKLLSYGPGLPHNLSRPDLSMQEGNKSIDDDIVQAFYPVADINDRLSSLLAGKDKSVSQATRAVIDALHMNDETTAPLEREEMRALAEAQAHFIADNYLSGDEAKEYLNIIGEIKSYADMSFGQTLIGYTSFEKGGKAVYKPKGTPEGYVPSDAALEMNDEKAYRQWRALPGTDPKSMEPLFTSNMEKYQKSAYKTLQKNLHTVNAAASLDKLRSLNTSSLGSFSHSFDAAVPSFSASQPLQDSMTRFISILL